MESQNCTSEVLALGKHQKVHEDLGPLSSRNKVLRLAQSFPQNDRLPRYGNPDLTQFQLNDVALFFLKYVWNIPADHFLSIARVWVVGLLCVNMVREYYDLIRGKKKSSKVHMFLILTNLYLKKNHLSLQCFQGKLHKQCIHPATRLQSTIWASYSKKRKRQSTLTDINMRVEALNTVKTGRSKITKNISEVVVLRSLPL